MIALWDTTGNEVVKALAAERRNAGGVASGLALTLVAVVDEKRVREAEAAATIAAAAHPCRLLIVVRARRRPRARESRLDAEIVVGGRLGPCEAVVMRMHGRLALHAESVVIPLLAPDVPVVTWWHERAAGADRLRPARRGRRAPDHRHRAGRRPGRRRCASGPRTTRPATPTWPGPGSPRGARCWPARSTPPASRGHRGRRSPRPTPTRPPRCCGGWLRARLGVDPDRRSGERRHAGGDAAAGRRRRDHRVDRDDGMATLQPHRPAGPDAAVGPPPARRRARRGAAPARPGPALRGGARRRDRRRPASTTGPAPRVHIWKDPALAERPEADVAVWSPVPFMTAHRDVVRPRRTPTAAAPQAVAARLIVRLVDAQAGARRRVGRADRRADRRADLRRGARQPGPRRGRLVPGRLLVGRRAVPAGRRPGPQRDPGPRRRCSTRCRSTRPGSTRCRPRRPRRRRPGGGRRPVRRRAGRARPGPGARRCRTSTWCCSVSARTATWRRSSRGTRWRADPAGRGGARQPEAAAGPASP